MPRVFTLTVIEFKFTSPDADRKPSEFVRADVSDSRMLSHSGVRDFGGYDCNRGFPAAWHWHAAGDAIPVGQGYVFLDARRFGADALLGSDAFFVRPG